MKRLADDWLRRWKDRPRRKPLLVRGARQVGKTHTVKAFGRESFEELVTIDFERDRRLHGVFEDDLDPKRILRQLRLLLDAAIRPGTSLLFLDEVQACPEALRALRYLWEEEPALHVVAAGSLVDFALDHIPVPVGRIQFLEMAPLTFVEFLWAQGQQRLGDQLLEPPADLGQAVHERLLRELRDFFFVGGMPEAVAAFLDHRSLSQGVEVQHELAAAFRQDFAKYAPRSDPRCLEAVFASVAQRVGEQTKYARLAEGFSGPTIRKAFDLLAKARVIARVPAAQPQLPLGATGSGKRFKTLMVDVGLCQSLRGTRYDAMLGQTDLLNLHRGAMAEQFVGQELMVSQASELFYWARQARGSTAEVDFLTSVDGVVIPVEVKSGAAGRLRSLHMLLADNAHLPFGLVLSTARWAELPEQRLRFLPIYHALGATLSTPDEAAHG